MFELGYYRRQKYKVVASSTCIKSATKSFLSSVFPENVRVYAVKETRYTTPARTTTIKRFGPSGSLKNENIALEHRRAVIPKIHNEIFFDMRCMALLYSRFVE